MKQFSFVVLLFLLVGRQTAEFCGQNSDLPLGLSQLTVYNVSIEPEEILKGPLFQLGNFDECLSIQGKQHCIARIRLRIRDKTSPLSSKVESSFVGWSRFPRDELVVGLCVPSSCNSSSTEVAFSKKLTPAANSLGIDTSVYIEPSYCQNVEERHATAGDYVMGTLSVIGVALLVVATAYEARLLMKKQGKTENGLVVEILVCFSLINNWKRLRRIKTTAETKPLRSIQGIRFITMYFVMTGHTAYAAFITAHDNSEWLEQKYAYVLWAFLFNGHLGVCSFFVIGGFLLGYMGMIHMETDDFTFLQYLKSIVLRYLRLTPALAVIVAVAANWLKYFGSGPLWPLFGLIEVNNCNHHWWINLIYLQNYFYAERPCMLHLWYLAADFQNFIAFALLLGFVYKYPNWAKTIFASTLAVFIFIPFIQTYLEELDPVFLTIPRNFKNVTYNRTYLRNYVTFHYNAAPYLIGMIYGYAYYNLNSKVIKLSKPLVALLWAGGFAAAWCMVHVGHFFYQPSYQYNVYIASFYASFSRPLYAFGVGLIVFGFSTGLGWFADTILSSKPLQVLGRLTYCSYLVHLLVLEAEYSSVRRSLHVSASFLVRQITLNAITSLLCGLVLCLCVELPTSAILKLITNNEPKENESPLPVSSSDVIVPTVLERTEVMYKTDNSETL